MVNTLFTPTQAARSSLAALRWLSTTPRTVRQDFAADFVAGGGQTVNVKGPISVGEGRVYTAANRTARAAIVFDDAAETTYPITMTDQVYKAVRVPDDFATFTLVSLERQLLVPMMEAVVDSLIAPLTAVMQAAATDAGVPVFALNGSNALDVFTAARKVLNERKVPMGERFATVGTNVAEKLLNLEQLTDASRSGDNGALRDATIGRIRGFTVVEDIYLDADTAVFYNRDAFAHVTRPSRPPQGAGRSGIASQDGIALRYLEHYNPLQLEDQVVVDAFVGAGALDPLRAVRTTTSAT